LLSNAEIAMYLDRDQYPSFQPLLPAASASFPARPASRSAVSRSCYGVHKDGKEISSQRIEPLLGTKLDFDLALGRVDSGSL